MAYLLFGFRAGILFQYFSHTIAGLKSHSHLTSKWIINNTVLGFNLKISFKKSVFQRLKTSKQQGSPLHRPADSFPCLVTGRNRSEHSFFLFVILTWDIS